MKIYLVSIFCCLAGLAACVSSEHVGEVVRRSADPRHLVGQVMRRSAELARLLTKRSPRSQHTLLSQTTRERRDADPNECLERGQGLAECAAEAEQEFLPLISEKPTALCPMIDANLKCYTDEYLTACGISRDFALDFIRKDLIQREPETLKTVKTLCPNSELNGASSLKFVAALFLVPLLLIMM